MASYAFSALLRLLLQFILLFNLVDGSNTTTGSIETTSIPRIDVVTESDINTTITTNNITPSTTKTSTKSIIRTNPTTVGGATTPLSYTVGETSPSTVDKTNPTTGTITTESTQTSIETAEPITTTMATLATEVPVDVTTEGDSAGFSPTGEMVTGLAMGFGFFFGLLFIICLFWWLCCNKFMDEQKAKRRIVPISDDDLSNLKGSGTTSRESM
ncbi:unnamed protein product [Owenia fusiformis]|uniref:Uncharacterized protein n=1 Tax=Owenia fusiformis TaxID=6347 RepID=A0A8J1U5N8_OWEFU|nr:unnamed protein product [Owenia fusiformis]